MSLGCYSPAQWKFAFHFLYHYQYIANREFAYVMLSSVNFSSGIPHEVPKSVKSAESLMLGSYILILLTVGASPAITKPSLLCQLMLSPLWLWARRSNSKGQEAYGCRNFKIHIPWELPVQKNLIFETKQEWKVFPHFQWYPMVDTNLMGAASSQSNLRSLLVSSLFSTLVCFYSRNILRIGLFTWNG